MDNKEKWDKVYKSRTPNELPWKGIPFLIHVSSFLKTLNKSELLIVPCCGVGDTVDQLYKEGFTNILGTDISSEAIIQAQKRFPHLSFKCLGTEELSKESYKNANVIDWLNFHQINPQLAPDYLEALNKISKSLFLAYFYDMERPYSQKSGVTGDLIYNYEPGFIVKLLPRLKKVDESVFYVAPKKVVGRLADKLRVVAQVYRK